MCGRYGRRADKQRIAEWMETHDDNVFDESFFAPSFNIAPQSVQPIVRIGRDTAECELTVMRWGLVPYRIGPRILRPGFPRSTPEQKQSPAVRHFAKRGSPAAVWSLPNGFSSGRRSITRSSSLTRSVFRTVHCLRSLACGTDGRTGKRVRN
jgi:hypothetical protein